MNKSCFRRRTPKCLLYLGNPEKYVARRIERLQGYNYDIKETISKTSKKVNCLQYVKRVIPEVHIVLIQRRTTEEAYSPDDVSRVRYLEQVHFGVKGLFQEVG